MTLGIMLEGVTLAIRAIEIKIPAFAGMTGRGGVTWGRWGLGGGRGGPPPSRGIRRGRGGFGGDAGDFGRGGYGVGCTVEALDSSLRSE